MNTFSRKKVAVFAGLLAILATFALALATTQAVFTSSVTNTGNTFSAGNLVLDVKNGDATVYSPFSVSGMAPGDAVYKAVRVANTGNLELRYSLSSTPTTVTGALASNLRVGVKRLASGNVCDASTYALAGSTVVVDDTAALLGATANTPKAVFGDATSGNQTGDRVLAGGANEVLCVKAELPLATTGGSSATSATYTFNWAAEQTANNS